MIFVLGQVFNFGPQTPISKSSISGNPKFWVRRGWLIKWPVSLSTFIKFYDSQESQHPGKRLWPKCARTSEPTSCRGVLWILLAQFSCSEVKIERIYVVVKMMHARICPIIALFASSHKTLFSHNMKCSFRLSKNINLRTKTPERLISQRFTL